MSKTKQEQKTKLYNSITNIDEKYIEETLTTSFKKKNTKWIKWSVAAACLILMIVCVPLYIMNDSSSRPPYGSTGSPSKNTRKFSEGNTNSTDDTEEVITNADFESEYLEGDHPWQIMINDRLYYSTDETVDFPDHKKADGTITSTCDDIPSKNNQSNFGTEYDYILDGKETVYVYINHQWVKFLLLEDS